MPREDGGRDQDRKRLEHILRCASDARMIVGASQAPELAADMVRSRALVKCFTEIGEAASRLSDATRGAMPIVPWRQVVALRNIGVHVYWGIDVAQLV